MKPIDRLNLDCGESRENRQPGPIATTLSAWAIPVAVGVMATMVVGGLAGFMVGTISTIGLRAAALANNAAAGKRQRRRDSAELPLALDIAAACLAAGAPLAQALSAAAAVVTGELGSRLGRTSRALRLGEPVLEAFDPLNGIVGADRVAAAVHRSHRTGAALAGGFAEVATRLRQEQATEATAAAHRAGVWLVLPLCLCFLPAFMLAGLVPVVLSVLDSVLTSS